MAGAPASLRSVSTAATAPINYSVEVPGKRVGRYINSEDTGELADVHEEKLVAFGNARELQTPANLEKQCFELRNHATAVKNFKDSDEVKRVYFPEMEALVKAATGAEQVFLFDHTIRDGSSGAGLNVTKPGDAAAPVFRVHTDYSDTSGPARVKTLAESGDYFSAEQQTEILSRDFCIVNVWRNISAEPVQSNPLAVLDPASIDKKEFLVYEMQYPDRAGQNFALKYNSSHKWYFYPLMEKEECLIFKTWEKRTDRPRYCFHTAFTDPATPATAPGRSSIEIRSIAIMPKSV
eukprot:CAMPEP_0115142626 /NCGR_PEP_ID=MMETSP0227-20121206/60269_1 /TAXON_ID=89957 /ORGANISM="Polarella glacialis, Strain CCMP 1383" /LENGTH=292 /DNA_ID=CAMNT_0002551263 /DNA_START=116 /DNA_END=994 /DNA_ORIENTATION=+